MFVVARIVHQESRLTTLTRNVLKLIKITIITHINNNFFFNVNIKVNVEFVLYLFLYH